MKSNDTPASNDLGLSVELKRPNGYLTQEQTREKSQMEGSLVCGFNPVLTDPPFVLPCIRRHPACTSEALGQVPSYVVSFGEAEVTGGDCNQEE